MSMPFGAADDAEAMAARLRQELTDRLVRRGALRSPGWRAAFSRVPRHRFVPRLFLPLGPADTYEALDGASPARHNDWLRAVYADQVLVTQLDGDDGCWDEAVSAGEVCGVPTSSSTEPGLMALMLEALEVTDGQRVLEVGTGTGYNAALLADRLGADRVTTVDVDTGLVDQARELLSTCGYPVAVHAGDGALGWADHSPYDRLIATCSVDAVPAGWVEQIRPGGLLVTALHRDLGGHGLVALRMQDDGTAAGRFLPGRGGFMPLRARAALPLRQLLREALDQRAEPRRTLLSIAVLDDPDESLWLALRLPGAVGRIGWRAAGTDGWQRFLLAGDGSWSRLTTMSEGTYLVEEGGPRRLWAEVEDAHEVWRRLGCPARGRLGLTVDSGGGHTVWLDRPDGSYRWDGSQVQ